MCVDFESMRRVTCVQVDHECHCVRCLTIVLDVGGGPDSYKHNVKKIDS